MFSIIKIGGILLFLLNIVSVQAEDYEFNSTNIISLNDTNFEQLTKI